MKFTITFIFFFFISIFSFSQELILREEGDIIIEHYKFNDGSYGFKLIKDSIVVYLDHRSKIRDINPLIVDDKETINRLEKIWNKKYYANKLIRCNKDWVITIIRQYNENKKKIELTSI
jgi:hypothetical protein